MDIYYTCKLTDALGEGGCARESQLCKIYIYYYRLRFHTS